VAVVLGVDCPKWFRQFVEELLRKKKLPVLTFDVNLPALQAATAQNGIDAMQQQPRSCCPKFIRRRAVRSSQHYPSKAETIRNVGRYFFAVTC